MTEHTLTRVAVTGADGFIGSALVTFLAQQEEVEAVYCLDKKFSAADPHRYEQWYQLDQKIRKKIKIAPYSDIDTGEYDLFPYDKKPKLDAVFHLAAKAGVPASVKDPCAYFKTNVDGTMNLIEYLENYEMLKPDSSIVAASSSTVYGSKSPLDIANLPPYNIGRPLNPYAASKLAMEMGLLSLPRDHVTVLRLFSVYGPYMRRDLALHKFAKQLLAGQPIEIYSGSSSLTRDYTYIDDVVSAFWLAAKINRSESQVLNVGTCVSTPVIDVVRLLAAKLGLSTDVEIVTKPSKAYDRPETLAYALPTIVSLGWLAKVTLEEGIGKFAEHFLELNRH